MKIHTYSFNLPDKLLEKYPLDFELPASFAICLEAVTADLLGHIELPTLTESEEITRAYLQGNMDHPQSRTQELMRQFIICVANGAKRHFNLAKLKHPWKYSATEYMRNHHPHNTMKITYNSAYIGRHDNTSFYQFLNRHYHQCGRCDMLIHLVDTNHYIMVIMREKQCLIFTPALPTMEIQSCTMKIIYREFAPRYYFENEVLKTITGLYPDEQQLDLIDVKCNTHQVLL